MNTIMSLINKNTGAIGRRPDDINKNYLQVADNSNKKHKWDEEDEHQKYSMRHLNGRSDKHWVIVNVNN